MDSNKEILTPSKYSGQFPVSVLMRYQKTRRSKWSSGQWEVSGLLAGEHTEVHVTNRPSKQPMRGDVENPEYLWSGLTVSLYKDDAENYYHNLMSDTPRAFVICRSDETDSNHIEPVIVTLSYGEASSYMEAEELVFSVDMPPELYRWVEQFVLEHYVPEKKKKRRRENWKESAERDTVK